MAARLAAGAVAIDGVQITHPPSANGVFAILPPGAADQLRHRYAFHTWDESRGEVRWMCSFDTSEADVEEFLAHLRAVL
jgi:threonine aldolase